MTRGQGRPPGRRGVPGRRGWAHHHRPDGPFGGPWPRGFGQGRRSAPWDGRAWGGPPLATRRHVPVAWFLLPAVLVIGGGAMAFTMILFVIAFLASVAVPVLVVGTTVGLIAHNRRRRASLRRGWAPGTVPLGRHYPATPPRPATPPWQQARARFDTLRQDYAAYECDPMQVLRLPALADVTVPSTGRFVEAFAEAQALETEARPGDPHAAAFVTAVDRAERAWRAARDAAERIRLSGLSSAERGTVERVIKLLTTARDSDSDAERLTAYTKARSELSKLERAGVIHLPRTAQAALDAAARGELPA